MNDQGETQLVAQLARIEETHAGSGGEAPRDRIRSRLRTIESKEAPIVVRCAIHDPWERKIFSALVRRYGLVPYRERGQRRTSVMVRVPKRFLDETLWPEFQQLSKALHTYLEVVTDRVIAKAIHENVSEGDEGPA